MFREIVLMVGNTGCGKSWWAKLFAQKYSRKFIYDPAMSEDYDCIYYHGFEIVEKYEKEKEKFKIEDFSYGVISSDDVSVITDLSYGIGNNLLILEELGTYFPKGMRQLPQYLVDMIFTGRHRACSMVLIAQRAISIPIDLRSQFDRIVTVRQSEKDDLDWLEGMYGKERIKRLAVLPKFTVLDFNKDSGQISEYSIIEKVMQSFSIKLDKRNSIVYSGLD